MATAGTGEEGRKKLTIAFIGAKGVGKTSIITVSRRHKKSHLSWHQCLVQECLINRYSEILSGFHVVP